MQAKQQDLAFQRGLHMHSHWTPLAYRPRLTDLVFPAIKFWKRGLVSEPNQLTLPLSGLALIPETKLTDTQHCDCRLNGKSDKTDHLPMRGSICVTKKLQHGAHVINSWGPNCSTQVVTQLESSNHHPYDHPGRLTNMI